MTIAKRLRIWPQVAALSGLLLSAALMLAALAVSAQAQQANCGPTEQVETALSGPRYAESVIQEQVVPHPENGMEVLFRVWLNETTGTWTLTATSPHGTTCLVAYGTGNLDGRSIDELLQPEPAGLRI